MKRMFLIYLVCVPIIVFAQEEIQRRIIRIRFEGLIRLDEETVRQKIKLKENDLFDEHRLSEDIKSIYSTGAFEYVEGGIQRTEEGIVLVFRVKERPSIDQILIEGCDEISEEDIRKKVGIKPAMILDIGKVEKTVEAIRDHYVEQGFFLAEVSYRLTPKEGNLVDVTFVIREYAKVKVHRIEFIGNQHIPDSELKSVMFTQEGSYLGFLTGKGVFSREMFEEDMRRLEFLYNTKGYAEVSIETPLVNLSRDRRFIVITITIHEGEQYTTGKVDIEGDDLSQDEKNLLISKLSLKSQEIFNAMNVQKDDNMLSTYYKDKGYAFATVTNGTILHKKERTIDFTYIIQKGEIAYVNRIDILGNDGTRDWTIRREMRIHEGDLYNESAVKESEARIKRLGFFEKVEVRTKPSRKPNEVDIIVEVKERQTGAFTVGVGISSVENFMFQAQISKQNFLGRGQSIALQAAISSIKQIYMLSFDEPYLFDTDWTFGIELYNYEMLYWDFTRKTKGFEISIGRRITDQFGLKMSYKLEGVESGSGGQRGLYDVPIAHMYEKGITSSLTFTAYYDSLDDRMFPTKGNFSSASLEWAGSQIGSDFDYLRLMIRSRQYFPFILGSVLKIAGTYGYIGSVSGQSVPFFERFFVGGIFTVRGFERFSLGPTVATAYSRDPASYLWPRVIGGNKELIFTAEVEFPIFMPVGIRGVIFADAGNAFDDDEQVDLTKLRTSGGFGIRWWSPIGPLRFEWGFPFRPKKGEPPVVFEFNIGTF